MASLSLTTKQRVINFGVFSYAMAAKMLSVFRRKLQSILFYQRREVIKFLADPRIKPERPKVIIAIAHITSPQESEDPQGKGAAKVERLARTIDGLLTSFAHCDLTLLVHSLPGRHVADGLPAYQRDFIQLVEKPDWDPMYIGYRVQDDLVSRVNDYDWFIFIEDDIVISDSYFLEKVAAFNRASCDKKTLLFPNRYEMYEGKKSYIDLTIDDEVAWDRISIIESDGAKLAECSNPHSAIYCLTQEQMRYWIKSGRTWKNESIMVGPLESAATFCLMECFSIYKPHPQNLNYFEVRHYDTKYSKLYPGPSPFIVSAIPSSSSKR